MCNCYASIDSELKKIHGGKISLYTGGHFGYIRDGGSLALKIAIPFNFEHDHSLCSSITVSGHHLVTARFCPFCGGKL